MELGPVKRDPAHSVVWPYHTLKTTNPSHRNRLFFFHPNAAPKPAPFPFDALREPKEAGFKAQDAIILFHFSHLKLICRLRRPIMTTTPINLCMYPE